MICLKIQKESTVSARANGLSSQTVLIENHGKFFVYQPASGVIASGDSVTIAYQKFMDAQRVFLDNVQEAGLTPAIQESAGPVAVAGIGPTGVAVHRSAIAELGLFAAKFGLVLVILGGAAVVAVGAIENAVGGAAQGISRAMAGLGSLTLSDVVAKSDEVVRDFKSVPDERKQDFRKNVGEISRQLSPIIEAWRNPTDAAAPK